jgi:chaperonin GroEL (HSP60 family)
MTIIENGSHPASSATQFVDAYHEFVFSRMSMRSRRVSSLAAVPAALRDQGTHKLTPANPDQKVGVEIVRKRKALQWPARQVAETSGTDELTVFGKLRESKDANYGYDAHKGEFTDMIKAGTLGLKVLRHALQHAASVAGLPVTTELMPSEKPNPKAAKPAMPPGGGMGEIDF